MSAPDDTTAPPTLEQGRYRISETPDGGLRIARAVNTCETCQGCGCGEQAEQVNIPGWMLKAGPVRDKMVAMFKRAMPGG